MELREEAWSPGPLDSEDQQMASHENPGEVALGGSSLPTPGLLLGPGFLGPLPLRGPGTPILLGSARPPPALWCLRVPPRVPGAWGLRPPHPHGLASAPQCPGCTAQCLPGRRH